MTWRRLEVLLVGLAVALTIASTAQARPVVFHVKWRLVGRGVLYAAADDDYAAVMEQSGMVTLIDEQTGKRRGLSHPGGTCGGGQLSFGGPWLAIACGQDALRRPEYALYNLGTRRWDELQVSPACFGFCQLVGIGRDWAKIASDEGQDPYGPIDYYLQNLQTGALERDPATPGGQTRDDLNAPDGTSPLCAPLRYPEAAIPSRHDYAGEPGLLTFAGPFALSPEKTIQGDTDELHLRRCGSRLNLAIATFSLGSYDGTFGITGGYTPESFNGTSSTVVTSSRAVISGPGPAAAGAMTAPLIGWLLPTARRFTIANLPAPSSLVNPVELVATSRVHIYVTVTRKLWAAVIPRPQ